MDNDRQALEVLDFWRAQEESAYFTVTPAFDAEIRRRFAHRLEQAKAGELDHWATTAEGMLALVILLDQMSRNIHRGTPAMYAGDDKALALAKEAVGRGIDQSFAPRERRWFYMPFMHSERLADQETCIRLCRTAGLDDTLPHAIEHADIIRRFGRFPHRNAILGRSTTAEEQAFLNDGGFSG